MIFKLVRFYWHRFADWFFFGKITEKVKSIDGGMPSEIEYRGRGSRVIGYWAYGYYDQSLPYPRGLRR